MPVITLEEIISACNPEVRGVLPADTVFRWIERNSRDVQPGDLFIAVRGERFDGHDFLADAAAHGATAALVRRDFTPNLAGIPLLAVEDPVQALQQIAAARRRSMASMVVVGITGSVGKTSTKEVVASVLERRSRTYRSPGNMNSEIGLPLSLLEIEPGTEVAVLEMGCGYGFGELELLTTIATPLIGVVTNVHPVHLERMGSIEAIAQAKSELVTAIPADGFTILNGDDWRVRAMAPLSKGHVIFVGRGDDNAFQATDVQTHGPDGVSFTLRHGGRSWQVRTPLVGGHAVELALIGVAVGTALGMTVDECLPGIEQQAAQIRLLLVPGIRESTLIDDTYNASAPSVLSALGLLGETPATRRIAVLGEMRELADAAEEQHRTVGQRAGKVADVLVTYGDMALTIAEEARAVAAVDGRGLDVTSFRLDERSALIDFLRGLLRAGDVALLKGSRGLEMEDFVSALAAESQESTG